METTMDSETETQIITSLVGFVRRMVVTHLPKKADPETFADKVIEIIQRECSDDRAMDLAEEMANKTETKKFEMKPGVEYYYVNDVADLWVSKILPITNQADFDKLPELDHEEGNALIAMEKRGSKTVAYEVGAEGGTEFGIELIQDGEHSDYETIEVFANVLSTLSNIGKGG